MAYQLVNLGQGTYGAYDPNTQLARSFSSEANAKQFFGTEMLDYSKAIAPTFDVSKLTGANADQLISFAQQPQAQAPTLNVPPAVQAPQLPTPTAPTELGLFVESQQGSVEAARKALEDRYKTEISRLDAEQAKAQKTVDETTKKQEAIIEGPVKEATTPFRADLEKGERARLQVDENYQANQKLINELDGLLTESNALMKKLSDQKVPGLAGLQQSPRIVNAMNNVAARVGVINAVMAARNNQIGVAENMIDRSVNAINADRKDQLNYYQTVLNFLETQRDEAGNKLVELDKQETAFLGAQIGLLESDLARAQESADYIKKLMMDPATAKMVAEAGVTLNDTPQQVNKKFATYIQAEELKMTQKENRERAFNKNVKTQFYSYMGEMGITNSGYAFTSPEDFLEKTGMTVAQAIERGLVTEIEPDVDLKAYPQSYQEYYLAVQQGYNKTFNEWLTEDANRVKRSGGGGGGSRGEKLEDEEGDVVDGIISEWEANGLLHAGVISSDYYKAAKQEWNRTFAGRIDNPGQAFDEYFNAFTHKGGRDWQKDYGLEKVDPNREGTN